MLSLLRHNRFNIPLYNSICLLRLIFVFLVGGCGWRFRACLIYCLVLSCLVDDGANEWNMVDMLNNNKSINYLVWVYRVSIPYIYTYISGVRSPDSYKSGYLGLNKRHWLPGVLWTSRKTITSPFQFICVIMIAAECSTVSLGAVEFV